MKKLCLITVTFALAVSCEKPQSEAEKNAQIEREVQQRLSAERQAADQQRLAQEQANLEAREKALAEKEAAADRVTATATPRDEEVPESSAQLSSSEDNSAGSYDIFYRTLEPYGAWRESSDYGFVWQPREAQRLDWRPYTVGRWVYTDAGWTWVSSEPFGWATYHYGRWMRLSGVGWVWVPGEEWAPAWVSWRTSAQHVGWAPLPPEARFERRTGIKKWADSYYDIDAGEYVFIPNEDIGDEDVQRALIPQEQNITIVNETTNVTNITYNNTTIVNEGPDYNVLRARSRLPLERKRIQRQYNVDGNQAPQAVVRGETIAMMTPLFTARAVERPRNVGAPIQQAKVERTTANNPEAEKTRAKMRSEATPPPDAPPKKFVKPAVSEQPSASPPASRALAPKATPTPFSGTTTPVPPVTSTPSPIPSVSPIASPSVAPSVPARAASTVAPLSSTTPPATTTAAPPTAASPAAEGKRREPRDERTRERRLQHGVGEPVTPAPSPSASAVGSPISATSPSAIPGAESRFEGERKKLGMRAGKAREMNGRVLENNPTAPVSSPPVGSALSPDSVVTRGAETMARPGPKLPATSSENAATRAAQSTSQAAAAVPPPAAPVKAPAVTTAAASDAGSVSPAPTPSPKASKSKRGSKPGKEKDLPAPQVSPSPPNES